MEASPSGTTETPQPEPILDDILYIYRNGTVFSVNRDEVAALKERHLLEWCGACRHFTLRHGVDWEDVDLTLEDARAGPAEGDTEAEE
jgi:hypothetical protein